MPRRPHLIAVAGLLLLGAGLFAPALGLAFWSGDDVFELPMGHLLAAGEFDAWWAMSSGSGHTGLRIVPRLVWALDAAVWGPRAAGYYATNLGLHLACMVAVYAVAWTWTRSIAGAFAGAATFALLGPSSQVVTFLSAREDSVATLVFAVAVALWPLLREPRSGPFGAAALYAAVCLSKESGATLPGLLFVIDLLTLPRSQAWSPRRLLRCYGPMTAVLGGLAWLWFAQTGPEGLGAYGALRGEGPGATASTSVLLANLYQGLWAPLSDHPAQPLGGWHVGLYWAQVVLLPTLTLLALLRPDQRRAFGIAAVWIVLGLLPPATLLGWGTEQSWGDGRYMQLPSAGLGLAVAAGVAAIGTRAAAIAGVVVALMATVFAVLVVPLWSLPATYCEDLADAVEGGEGRLIVAWPRLDRGAKRMLDGGFLRAMAPSLPDPFYVLIEGADSLIEVRSGDDPRLDDTRTVERGFSLDELDPTDRLIAPAANIDPRQPEGPRFDRPSLPLPPPGFERTQHFLFDGAIDGWRLGPGARGQEGFDLQAPMEPPYLLKRGGLALTASGQLDWPGNPEPPEALYLPELISPDLRGTRPCSVALSLRVKSRPGRPGQRLLEPDNFGVLNWTSRRSGREFEGALTFPLQDHGDSQRVIIDLHNSPSWRRSRDILRVGLTPSALPASVVVESVSLRGCAR
jgi:hypothetical protein